MISNGAYLFLDTSSAQFEVGLLKDKRWLSRKSSQEPALEGLFQVVEGCLYEANETIEGLKGVIFCSGPGSILGARVASVAVKTWQILREHEFDIYSFENLHCLALQRLEEDPKGTFAICNFWKRDNWNVLKVQSGKVTRIKVLSTTQLESFEGDIYYFKQRSNDAEPSFDFECIENDLELFPRFINSENFLRKTSEPEIYTQDVTVYKKWDAQIHASSSKV